MEIAEIKSRLTLAQVLQHYGLKPDKHLRLHCPFHDDKTPSLQVYYKTHTAYCFSANCKTHGRSLDVIDFVMLMENGTKHEALQKCVALLGGTTESAAPVAPRTRTAILQQLFTYFKNAVHNSKPAQAYIQSRALDYTTVEIGYNTGQFHHGARKDEALIQSCLQVGLLSVNDRLGRTGETAYKPFAKYCIVFALYNAAHQVTGLYFRSTLNDSDQRHFYLRDRQGLYPKYPAPDTTKLILTESVIDAATLLQVPAITERYSVLALYGTNGLTEEHITAIQSLSSLAEIILWLNADEPGLVATNKQGQALQALNSRWRITTVTMPAGEDINSLAQTHSDGQIFTDLLATRTDFIFCQPPFLFSNEGAGEGSLSIEKENQLLDAIPDATNGVEQSKLYIDAAAVKSPSLKTSVRPKAKPSENQSTTTPALETTNPFKLIYRTETAIYYIQGGLPKVTDHLKIMLVVENGTSGQKARNRVDLYEDKQVERLAKDVSERLQLRRELLEVDLYRLTDLLEQHRDELLQQEKQQSGQSQYVLTPKEKAEAEAFAKKPKLLKRLNDLLGGSGIVGEERNRLFLLLIAISHKTADPLHALIQGSSGSGKTRLLKQISDCMPPESVTRLTRLSDKVLYNFPEQYFMNRLLCLEDIDGLSEEAEFAFRELQSNGELNSATSIKLDSGQITSGQKTVRGPIASLACTTRGEIYEDNMSRVFLIAVDESPEQTARIIDYQNGVAAGAINKSDEEKTKCFLQNWVRLLQPLPVVNPYAGQLRLPPEAHKIRRLNDLFQGFVKMVTLVNQYQRTRDEKGRLLTALEDVELAVHVLFESIVLKVDELDGSLRQFFERLKTHLQTMHGKHYLTAEFTLREIRQSLGVSKTQTFRYASDLVRLEYLRPVGGHLNKGLHYRISYWDNYQALREKIKQNLEGQLKALKSGTLRNAGGTLEPA
ncbi:MAG: toprim domain-containing protein [Bacteroidetes bacterium]|nr:toprim domain-containing protein [Bacteroidota bacterium]